MTHVTTRSKKKLITEMELQNEFKARHSVRNCSLELMQFLAWILYSFGKLLSCKVYVHSLIGASIERVDQSRGKIRSYVCVLVIGFL